MSLAQILSTYITLQIFIILSFLILRGTKYLLQWRHGKPSARIELKLHYSVLTAITLLTFVHPFLPKQQFFNPPAKVWSAQSIKTFTSEYTAPDKGGYLSIPSASGNGSVLQADSLSLALAAIAFCIFVFSFKRIWQDITVLRNIRKRSFLTKKIKRVSIFINDEISVPFSYWFPGSTDVVVPSTLLSKPLDYRMAVAHELQHHRHRDTQWVYVMWALRIICAPNPFIHIWSRWISEIQEFACDEALVDQGKVESHPYARCLVEVAQTAIDQKYVPACATGLTFLTESNLLHRRIEQMFSASKINKKRSISWVTGGLIVALMTATAFASQGLVQDRRVGMTEAKKMLTKTTANSDFPVVVNDLVLKQLNRYIGTPEGREYMKNALQRLENYRNLVEGKLKDYQVPFEILALPIIESGYQNLSESDSNTPGKAAGLWQFIPSTAKNFGMQVNDQVDERLNVDIETDAAMRYLKAEQLAFKDWHLSVMSYNMGSKHLQRGIDKTGSRNAWTLIRNGFENDKDYLPKLMAAILIMSNPESVQ